MDHPDAITLMKERGPELRRRFGLKSLSVFGSAARGEASAGSDLDVLAEFEGQADFDRFMDLKFYLEDLLGGRVDLTTPKALHPRLRPQIEREAVHVA